MADTAFWLTPDWSGGDNLRDGPTPFWMLPPAMDDDERFVRNWLRRSGPCFWEDVPVLKAIEERGVPWVIVATHIKAHAHMRHTFIR